MKKYCERILKLRESKGLTQAELAKKLSELSTDGKSVSREMVNLWEKGSRDLKTSQIIIICKFFNVTADYLLGISDCMSVEPDVQVACKVTGIEEKAILEIKKNKFYAAAISILASPSTNKSKDKEEESTISLISKYFFTGNDLAHAAIVSELMKRVKAGEYPEISMSEAIRLVKEVYNYYTGEETLELIEKRLKTVRETMTITIVSKNKKQEDSNHDETNSQPE